MKKSVFVICLVVFTIFSLSFSAFGEETGDTNNTFSLDELYEILDENTKEFLEENNIDIYDYNSVKNLKSENVLKHIFMLFKDGISDKFSSLAVLIGIILLGAVISSFDNENIKDTVLVIGTAVFSLIIANDVWGSVSACVDAIRNTSKFMLSFIPILSVVTFMSGGTLSSAITSGMLVFIAQCVSFAFSYIVIPFMGVYLGITFVSSVCPFDTISEISESVKKITIWTLSLISTVFIGVLGIQTTINSQADSIGLKTVKFIIGTAIPIAGSSLAEATNTVYTSMSLMRSTVGIYGIIAISVMVIPIIIEILVWKAIFLITEFLSKILTLSKTASIIKSLSNAFSQLLTIVLFSFALFVISLGIVIAVGKIQ